MKRIFVLLCFLALAGGIFWKYPLFRIVRSTEQDAGRHQETFDASAFADTFWNEKLLASLRNDPGVPDAARLIESLRENPQSARQEFGRRVGISRTRLFILRGSGVVVSVDKQVIGVALQPEAATIDIAFHTGPVFGNIVRDASGLLDPGDFSNSQHLNDISMELNRIVEARVIPKLKELATKGQKIQFVGCAELPDEGRDVRPLKVIPLDVNPI